MQIVVFVCFLLFVVVVDCCWFAVSVVVVVLISITIRSVFSMNTLGKGEMCRFTIFEGKIMFQLGRSMGFPIVLI